MKFNIGDKVVGNSKATDRYLITKEGWTGTVTAVKPDHFFARADKYGANYQLRYEYFGLLNPVTTAGKIVITSDGKTTLARLYDGTNLTKSAEAKCSPTDTYDFATGANLAYDRLMRPTPASVKPQDKPKFKVGDKAKVVANSGNPRHFFEVGQIVNIGEVHQRYNGEWCARCTRRDGEQNINFCDLEPYAEPAKEPVKLYCVKDYEPGHWCTKGKIYEINANGGIAHDDGWVEPNFLSFMRSGGHIDDDETEWSDYLVPLVARPAKAGEWVLIVSPYYTSSEKDYTKGAIYKVLSPYSDGVCINNDHGRQTNVYHSEYLTLDGYDGRYEPKEPKYYSGKVVCVETHDDFTVGKVYTFANGKVTDDGGMLRPANEYHAETLEQWNRDRGLSHAQFIEYKGEAT